MDGTGIMLAPSIPIIKPKNRSTNLNQWATIRLYGDSVFLSNYRSFPLPHLGINAEA